jgi:hypothetical protein
MTFGLAGNGLATPILASLGPTGSLQRRFPSVHLLLFRECLIFHGVCARFLISSEENNRYGYDYRSGCFDAASGD